MNSLSTSKINQLPDLAVELIVEFSGDPFSVMALNSFMRECVAQLFEERARAKKVRQLGRILRPIVRESMETQRKSVFQEGCRRLNNHLCRLSPRFFGQGPTSFQREYVVRAMDEDRFDILALKISIDKISGGPEFIRKERGDFFIKVLMKSIEVYDDDFLRTRSKDPDRIEERITGLGASIQLRERMQRIAGEREPFSSIFRRNFSLILPWITLALTQRDHFPERIGDWRLWFNRDPMEDNALHEARIRDCYMIASMISWIDCLSDSQRKIDLMSRLETECIASQRLLGPPDVIRDRWLLYMIKHLKETRNLSDQERVWERLALARVHFEKVDLRMYRQKFWCVIVLMLIIQGLIIINYKTRPLHNL